MEPAEIKLLVVDDDARILQTYARSLVQKGYQVLTAASGTEALQLYTVEWPDVVITDLRMYPMDGWAVLHAVRARDPNADVILMTGHGDLDTAITALRAGASDFVTKPVDMQSLEAVLRRAHERIRLKRELQEAQAAIRSQAQELAERVKELDCLSLISSLLVRHDISQTNLLQGVVDLIPLAYPYPEAVGVRVVLGRQRFQTANFMETERKQTTDIFLRGERAGILEVCYLEERPSEGGAFFLQKDWGMIVTVARQLEEALERIQARQTLQESSARFINLVRNIPGAVYRREIIFPWRITFISDGVESIAGYVPARFADAGDMVWGDLVAAEDLEDVKAAIATGAASQRPYEIEYRLSHADGSVRWVYEKGRAIETPMDVSDINTDRQLWLDGVIVDITPLKTAEARIRASLQEKEVLLKELHHRVKNNMAIISSLLSWQAEMLPDELSRRSFAESQNRIRAMARVHEYLYGTQELDRVLMADYIEGLGNYLKGVYNAYAVDFAVEAPDVALDIDAAVPCGLILNELLSNAFQHAFPNLTECVDNFSPEIKVTFHRMEMQYVLVVSDNGVGLDEGVDLAQVNSLGMNLVYLLARQLNGTLEIKPTASSPKPCGTTFRLVFAVMDEAGTEHGAA
ncbi:MAG: response regulator [Anaerolineae bacterium]|nr:response regulator [Anaerolineae bacterium]